MPEAGLEKRLRARGENATFLTPPPQGPRESPNGRPGILTPPPRLQPLPAPGQLRGLSSSVTDRLQSRACLRERILSRGHLSGPLNAPQPPCHDQVTADLRPEIHPGSCLCQTRRMRTTSATVTPRASPLPVAPVPSASSEAVRRRMQHVRRRDTRPERLLRQELHRRGLRYRVDVRPLPQLRRKADIVFSVPRVAVFVDGCFWHSCPHHRSLPKSNRAWWRTKLERTRQRDTETTNKLEAADWTVVRVWEHDNPIVAAELIAMLVRARRPQRTRRTQRADPL